MIMYFVMWASIHYKNAHRCSFSVSIVTILRWLLLMVLMMVKMMIFFFSFQPSTTFSFWIRGKRNKKKSSILSGKRSWLWKSWKRKLFVLFVCLVWVAQLIECQPVGQKVWGLSPWQDTFALLLRRQYECPQCGINNKGNIKRKALSCLPVVGLMMKSASLGAMLNAGLGYMTPTMLYTSCPLGVLAGSVSVATTRWTTNWTFEYSDTVTLYEDTANTGVLGLRRTFTNTWNDKSMIII